MTKMKFYKQAEAMYIEGNLPIDVISQNLNISRRTLFYWKKKYEWDKKCFEEKHNQEIFSNELFVFARKLMQKISTDVDNDRQTPQSEIYSIMNILKNLTPIKQNKIAKQKVNTLKPTKQLTPETIEQIKRNILGIY